MIILMCDLIKVRRRTEYCTEFLSLSVCNYAIVFMQKKLGWHNGKIQHLIFQIYFPYLEN